MLLQASAVPAPARITVREYCHVPDLASHPQRSPQDLAIHDDSSANAGSKRDQDKVVDLAAGSNPLLAQGGRVRVVFEKDRGTEPVLNLVPNREALEAGEISG